MSEETLIYVGRTNWRGRRRPFGMRAADRRAHMYVIGKTGAGKSSLIEALARQDVVAGHGLALFDPHGDLAERLRGWTAARRPEDLIYLDVPDPLQPFGFNPLADVPPLRRSVAANGIVEAFKKIFAESWGVRMEFLFRSALLLLLEQPEATLADVPRLFHDAEFRKTAAGRVTNEQVRRFWTSDFENFPARFRSEATFPIENKLGNILIDPFLAPILTQPKSSFDPRELMDTGKVLLVNLSKGKLGEAPAMLFGSLLVSALGVAGLARGDTPAAARRDFYIYLDEFHTFTTLALANMFSELRKYSVSILAAGQYLDLIQPEVRSAILGNVGTLVVFRVGATDAARLAKELGPKVDVDDLTFLPNRQFWVRLLVKGEAIEPFTAETIELRLDGEAA